ncbi:class I SAM-dependent methyltransferase [Mycobacterium sp. AT1]|uniref:THUMP-like domain-containing protein n=1 Tax=Mycobacterium sp. AT1 TaxID=1961706 RepID=UPI001301B90D|nr:class I SAM-dependent methyltransferase [Mycobacterium sp. AT1]
MASRRAEGLVLQRHDHRGQAVLKGGGLGFTLDDVAYLGGDEGGAAVAEVDALALTDASRISDIASARARFGDRAAVLVETTLLRRKAKVKFPHAGQWLFTGEALEQSTAAAVAAHRAERLTGRAVHDVTCSIGTELAALRDRADRVVGSDLDEVRVAMARHNLGGDGSTVLLCRADALAPVTRDTTVVADPARRSGGRRTFDPRDYTPALDELLEVYAGRDLVVKCAPGIDFDQVHRLGFDGEIEVTSLGGGVREACLWSQGLGTPGVTRRATILDRAEEITDAESDDCPVAAPGRWIVDPDGAVVRAGLVRHYGARHGLWQLDPAIAYLSGDELPTGVRGFEVIAEFGLTERTLRQELSARDVGALEILVRGVSVDPDELRTRLRLRGSQRLSLVITRIGAGSASRSVVYLCRPSR